VLTVEHAVRGLLRRRGYAIAVAGSLALGFGANIAVFSLVEQSLLKRLPYASPERLVVVGASRPAGTLWSVSAHDIEAWRGANHTLDGVAWLRGGAGGGLSNESTAALRGATADARLLDVLGVRPTIGRWYTNDEADRAAPVAIITDAVWQSRFQRDPAFLRRSALRVDGRLLTIIGVLPAGVELPIQADFWYPSRDRLSAQMIGRIRSGATISDVRKDLAALLVERRPGTETSPQLVVQTLRDRLFGGAAPMLRLFGVTSILLLVLASTNVANLCLARVAQRRREFAVYSALGAPRSALISMLVTEYVLLIVGGTVGGVILGMWLSALVGRYRPRELVAIHDVSIGSGTAAFTAVCGFCVLLFLSWIPAAAARRSDLRVLGGGGLLGVRVGGRNTARSAFVVAQVVVAVALLSTCGLLAKSLSALTDVDVGFDRRGLVVAQFDFLIVDDGGYRQRLSNAFAARLAQIPGVRSVAVGPPPLIGGRGPSLSDGYSMIFPAPTGGRPEANHLNVWVKYVSPAYLATFGMTVLEGRGFRASDDEQHPAVAIVNPAAAQIWFPDGHALNRVLSELPATLSMGRPVSVVGIVRETRQRDLDLRAEPEILVPIAQQDRLGSALYATMRVDGGVEAVGASARAIAASASDVQLRRVFSMDDVVSRTLASQTFLLVGFVAIATIAVILATVGVYAVVTLITGMRAKELGIRLALGASKTHVRALVVRGAAAVVLLGAILALPLTFVLGRAVSSFLYEVSPWDTAVILASAMLVACVAIAAAFIPAYRAGQLDPVRTLREQ
jgi:predicted permease